MVKWFSDAQARIREKHFETIRSELLDWLAMRNILGRGVDSTELQPDEYQETRPEVRKARLTPIQ